MSKVKEFTSKMILNENNLIQMKRHRLSYVKNYGQKAVSVKQWHALEWFAALEF